MQTRYCFLDFTQKILFCRCTEVFFAFYTRLLEICNIYDISSLWVVSLLRYFNFTFNQSTHRLNSGLFGIDHDQVL